MRKIVLCLLILPTLALQTGAGALPPTVVDVGDVREPLLSIAGSAGAFVFLSDRPRLLGDGRYSGAAENVWVPPGASQLVVAGAGMVTITRHTVPGVLELTSPAFANGGRIPDRFTCAASAPPSPELRWTGLPEGTVELALVMDDPDTPRGNYVHWVLYGIDPTLGAIEEGSVPAGATVGSSAYNRPCPPQGDGVHRYHLSLYALSAPSGLGPGATPDELRAAIAPLLLDHARLIGTYTLPPECHVGLLGCF
jgi:hypothetical protein